MIKPIALIMSILFLSGCTKEETTTSTLMEETTTSSLKAIVKTTSTGFPRLKPVLNNIILYDDKTFNGTFTNTAGYSIKLLGVDGMCAFFYPRTQIGPTDTFSISGKACKGVGDARDRFAMPMDIRYLVLTPGPVNEYEDHGVLRGSIRYKNG